ncbi:hypothetical protein [Paraburkholderia bannensis]|uniref:hypothetical protein n=1 Tax=Paraburkholderia bannensis TaxID=765414 RepID=UPI002AB67F29|nr:hypothetical protein [Paraburkholderia bannensis]
MSKNLTLSRAAVPLPLPVIEFCSRQMIDDEPATAVELLTVGSNGWPLVAHLSTGEIYIDLNGALRIALWSGTRSNAALQATRKASLIFVCDGSIYEVSCRCVAVQKLEGPTNLDGFLLTPVDVRDKSAPYAQVVSGVAYTYRSPLDAQAHWATLQSQLPLCF